VVACSLKKSTSFMTGDGVVAAPSMCT
jgi:hypothetical protein